MSTRKAATNNGFLIFTDQLAILENIPDENIGKAIKLLLKNFETMDHINEEPLTNTAYELIATNIRRYREESLAATEYGKQGGNPTLNPTLKGTLNPTLKQQDKTRQDNTIQEININNKIPTEGFYGKYNNVFLTAVNYRKLEVMAMSKKKLQSCIDYLSVSIEAGDYKVYDDSMPNKHYEILTTQVKRSFTK